MAGKRRKATKKDLVVRNSVTAAGVIAATASLSVASPTAIASAAAAGPNYTQDIASASNAFDNYLQGTYNFQNSFNGAWNPIAGPVNGAVPGLLPTFTQGLSGPLDVTKLSNLPGLLRGIASTPLPTAVPGVLPQLNIPGAGFVGLPLPATIPGAGLLNGLASGLDEALKIPVVGGVLNGLPSLGSVISGLIATQNNYNAAMNWGLLGISSASSAQNTFLQTPTGVVINTAPILNALRLGGLSGLIPAQITVVQPGTLPQVTGWLPIAQSTLNTPLGSAGLWGAMPTLALSNLFDQPDTVLSIPMFAAGYQAPMNLGQIGGFSANVLLPTQNGVYSPIGATLSNFSLPALGFGATNLNLTTGNYFGTNGFNVNDGQNALIMQTPLTGALPIPIVYSLGGVNMGVDGMGFTMPSLFGVSLIPTIQIGTAPGANTPSGLIPTNLIPGGAILPTNLVSVSGLISGALGVQDPFSQIGPALTPLYKALAAPILTPLSNQLTQQYGSLFDGAVSANLQMSQFYKSLSTQLTGGLGGLTALTNPLAGATSLVQAPSGTGGSNPLLLKALNAAVTPAVNPQSAAPLATEPTSNPLTRTLAEPVQTGQTQPVTGASTPAAAPAAPEPAAEPPAAVDPAPKSDNKPKLNVSKLDLPKLDAPRIKLPDITKGAAKNEAPETEVKTADPKDPSTEVKTVETKESGKLANGGTRSGVKLPALDSGTKSQPDNGGRHRPENLGPNGSGVSTITSKIASSLGIDRADKGSQANESKPNNVTHTEGTKGAGATRSESHKDGGK